MKDRINRLSKGMIDMDIPECYFTPDFIDMEIKSDESFCTQIVVSSKNSIKGLVYSSNRRVKVQNTSFSGPQNNIILSVDTRYLDGVQSIDGKIDIVTNAGEYSIPYYFRISSGTVKETLDNIHSIEDFATVASQDKQTALRIFEYKEFASSSFMNEPRLRALYDVFSNRPNPLNALEEFLVATGVKRPVCISLAKDKFFFGNIQGRISHAIPLVMDCEGSVSFAVKTDGDFISLSKKYITEEEFIDGRYDYIFDIDPTKFHKGKNLAYIDFVSSNITLRAVVEAGGLSREEGYAKEDRWYKYKHFSTYMKYRIAQECFSGDDGSFTEPMLTELSLIERKDDLDYEILLLKAEALVLASRYDDADIILGEIEEDIRNNKKQNPYNYFLFEYLKVKMYGQQGRKESLLKLLYRYLKEEHMHLLFPMIMDIDDELRSNPSAALELMRSEYHVGNRSPYLYAAYCKLLIAHPNLLHNFGKLEIHALYFGAKHNMITKELATRMATINIPSGYPILFFNMFLNLYSKYETVEILAAICSILIKADRKDRVAHSWYESGLKSRADIAGLYEYYMMSINDKLDRLLPKEILVYFAYSNNLDANSKAILYENIILYMPKDDELYAEYKQQIDTFTVNQLLLSRVDRHLATLYTSVIYEDMIDEKLAKALPAILNSCKITCTNKQMKSILVIYPMLKTAEVYGFSEVGGAYIPIYTSDAIVLFQDSYSNRYFNVDYTCERIIDSPILLDRCFRINKRNTFLRLRQLREVYACDEFSDDNIAIVEDALGDMPLSSAFKSLLLKRLVDFYKNTNPYMPTKVRTKPDFLIKANSDSIPHIRRCEICETLISMGYIKDAYDIIKEYYLEDIATDKLERLCSKTIRDRLFAQDPALVSFAKKAFDIDAYEGAILDYLCEHFNGSSQDMYEILKRSIRDHIETSDLEERLIAQMLFSGEHEHLDEVFDWYVSRKKTSDTIVKAYFTIKSCEYFVNDTVLDESMFDYLETIFSGTVEKGKVAIIYQLALTKYFSSLESLTDIQKNIATDIIENLTENGLVFPYYRKLAAFINIPNDITDKAMIVYFGNKNTRPELHIQTIPGDENMHIEEMHRMYLGIYIKQRVLFSGEKLVYKIYENTDDGQVLKDEGVITYDISHDENSRFEKLNRLSSMNLDSDLLLEKNMKDFCSEDILAHKLFGLI